MLLLVTSCGISEDCFKGNGTLITQAYPFEDFTKIKVYNGIALVIKEGTNYEVKVVTSDNISKELDFQITEGMLVIKDNSTCNMDRVYGQTTVYITTPNLEEIYSKTEQDIKSDGILRFPILRLFSFGDDGDGAGTGDFYLDVDNSQLVVESNNVSNYYLNGKCQEFIVNFYFGDGRLKGENLIAQNIYIYNRGSNDMFVYPVQKIEGTIVSTGNVILKNVPQIINVVELFTGKLIY
jgi:hypothetical protein